MLKRKNYDNSINSVKFVQFTHLDKGKQDTSHTQYRFTKNMTFYPHTHTFLSSVERERRKMPQKKISTHVSARTKWYDNSNFTIPAEVYAPFGKTHPLTFSRLG